MVRSGKLQAVEDPLEQISDVSRFRSVPKPFIPSIASMVIRTKTHPWLKWLGCSANRKVELNNNLATIQDKAICPPKFLDWDLCTNLGIDGELDTYFLTSFVEPREVRPVPYVIPVWRRAFDVREDSYREWCLEFYSSLDVDVPPERNDLVYSTPIIKFRLGGKEHKVTISQFGFLAGLFTREEAESGDGMAGYGLGGSWCSNDVKERKHGVWLALSGKPQHTTTSKVVDITSPMLRLIHKAISYSFLQRTTHQDKV